MGSHQQHVFQWAHGSFGRVLGFVLLILVFYGTTVEAGHRHSRIRAGDSTSSAAGTNTSKGVAGGTVGCADCLICQLQQGFSNTALGTVRYEGPQFSRTDYYISPSLRFQSEFNTAQNGRAPPIAS